MTDLLTSLRQHASQLRGAVPGCDCASCALARELPRLLDGYEAAIATARTEGRNEAARDMIRVCGERDDARRALDEAQLKLASLRGTP